MPDVLIVGAGPTGLMLAVWLVRQGVGVRVVDEEPGPALETRAIAVQARTLEFFDQLGLGKRAHEEGREVHAADLWVHARRAARVRLGDFGRGISPHPYFFILTQDRTEAILLDELRTHGVDVDWSTRLTGLRQDKAGVGAVLRHADGRKETARTRYLCGCDGARSATRTLIGATFPGGTYDQVFYVADVTATGALVEGELNLCLEDDRFYAYFPMPGRDHYRIVGLVPDELAEGTQELGFEDVRADVEGHFPARVQDVSWFATYHVHHRVTHTWRAGRVFLAGDAAHLHSPAGGQGMNTGLGDAVNLAWKLAAVLRGEADPALLDTYQAERAPFARTLVATTDRAFALVVSPSRLARTVRTRLVPRLVALATRLPAVRRLAFRTISQTRIRYPDSPLSAGRAGRVRGGDRLPWVPLADGSSNFEPLTARRWQVHVHGTPGAELEAWCARHDLPLEVFPFTREATGRTGLAEDAVYLVRPDGHVGLAAEAFLASAFDAYWQRYQDGTGLSGSGVTGEVATGATSRRRGGRRGWSIGRPRG
jgi:2-polyprenyl-6-methoxyphenol hydroxylase-like FAD-dependent oxidoreductase